MTKRVRRSVAELERDLRALKRIRDARQRRAKELRARCDRLRGQLLLTEKELRRVLGAQPARPRAIAARTATSTKPTKAAKPTVAQLVRVAHDVANPAQLDAGIHLGNAIYAVLQDSEPLTLRQLVAALRAAYPHATHFTPDGARFDQVVSRCLLHNFRRFMRDPVTRRHSVRPGQ